MIFVLVLLCLTSALANPVNETVGDRYGSLYTDITDFTEIPFVAAIYDPINDIFAGGGVIISARWVLTVYSDVGETVSANPTSFIAYQNIADPATLPSDTTSVQHLVGQCIVHEQAVAEPWVYDVTLIQVCPKFTGTFATLPSASQTYVTGSTIDVYIYRQGDERFQKSTTNTIQDDSVCQMSIFNSAFHYCVQSSDSDGEINSSDLEACTIVMQNGNLIGLASDNDTPECAILKIEVFQPWIDSKMV